MKKRNLLVITIVVTMLVLLVGCSTEVKEPEWVLVSENELLAAKVESRPLTNGMGGVKGYRNYITYCYVNDDGTVDFDEHQLFKNYSGYTYEVIFKYPSEENKVVQYQQENPGNVKSRYYIYLTQERYEQIFNPQNGEDVN